MANEIKFYKCKPLVNGNPVACIEARILIALDPIKVNADKVVGSTPDRPIE
jgi:hypothetical protein